MWHSHCFYEYSLTRKILIFIEISSGQGVFAKAIQQLNGENETKPSDQQKDSLRQLQTFNSN